MDITDFRPKYQKNKQPAFSLVKNWIYTNILRSEILQVINKLQTFCVFVIPLKIE